MPKHPMMDEIAVAQGILRPFAEGSSDVSANLQQGEAHHSLLGAPGAPHVGFRGLGAAVLQVKVAGEDVSDGSSHPAALAAAGVRVRVGPHMPQAIRDEVRIGSGSHRFAANPNR
eukprot:scaffold189_cov249-Pinguiococcus_pyrenoidosus.AAC.8